tara:strand:- start:186 stop:1532 length:1347 start_codon:yes stop_codon:yes gene_type:complete
MAGDKYTPTNYKLSTKTLASLKSSQGSYLASTQALTDFGNSLVDRQADISEKYNEEEAKRLEEEKKLEDQDAKDLELEDQEVPSSKELQADEEAYQMDQFNQDKLMGKYDPEEVRKKQEAKRKDDSLKAGDGPTKPGGATASPVKKLGEVQEPVTRDWDKGMKEGSDSIRSRGGVGTKDISLKFKNMLGFIKDTEFFNDEPDPMQGNQKKIDALSTVAQLGVGMAQDFSKDGSIQGIKEIQDGPGWSKALSEDDKQVMTHLYEGNLTPTYDDNNNLSYIIPMEDGSIRVVNNGDINDFSKMIYPHSIEAEFQDAKVLMREQGRTNSPWDKEGMVAQSKKMITQDNITSLAIDPVFGNTKSLLQQMQEGGVLPDVDINWLKFAEGAKEDNQLFEELSNLMAEGIERILHDDYQVGLKKHHEENIAIKSLGSNKTEGMSAAQKIQFYKNL